MGIIDLYSMAPLINHMVDVINDIFWGYILVTLLVAAGVYFTVRLKGLQFRYFALSWKLMLLGENDRDNHVSPFEALATSLAARVGSGNIAGVAVAITLGGPGAVFWMWVVAFLGMATAFVEATLAQLFKHAEDDGTFIGGPAYYIERGLGQRWLGILFAILLIIAFGCVFIAIQSNTISHAALDSMRIPAWATGLFIALLTVPIIFGGITRIAHVAGKIVPAMAIAYLIVAFVVIALEFDQVLGLLVLIVKSAFGLTEASAGMLGIVMANGIKRGLFSNEAGMGSAPNIAAAADPTPPHPAAQGFVQMLGVYIDTIFVCTATALIILLSGEYQLGQEMQAVVLTQNSLAAEVGEWGNYFLTVVIFFFCFTTILGNYAYSESCIKFISHNKWLLQGYRIVAIVMIGVGVEAEVPALWNAADASMALMATVNLVAILLLGKYAFALANDFLAQRKAGKEPIFDPHMFPELQGKISQTVWYDPDENLKEEDKKSER